MLRMGICAALLSANVALAKETDFYIATHQDDWQLFMSLNAQEDVEKGAKVVFLYITAGDAGLGKGSNGKSHPYYLARNRGANLASQFLADIGQEVGAPKEGKVSLSGHQVLRREYKNTVSYFFHLPNAYYGDSGNTILENFRQGKMNSISAVDGSANYPSWAEFIKTLKAAISREMANTETVWLNLPDTDTKVNPGDHADHLAAAIGAEQATASVGCVNRRYFVDYHLGNLPENLTSKQIALKSALFGITINGITEYGHGGGNWEPWHMSFLTRNVSRNMMGSGKCR